MSVISRQLALSMIVAAIFSLSSGCEKVNQEYNGTWNGGLTYNGSIPGRILAGEDIKFEVKEGRIQSFTANDKWASGGVGAKWGDGRGIAIYGNSFDGSDSSGRQSLRLRGTFDSATHCNGHFTYTMKATMERDGKVSECKFFAVKETCNR